MWLSGTRQGRFLLFFLLSMAFLVGWGAFVALTLRYNLQIEQGGANSSEVISDASGQGTAAPGSGVGTRLRQPTATRVATMGVSTPLPGQPSPTARPSVSPTLRTATATRTAPLATATDTPPPPTNTPAPPPTNTPQPAQPPTNTPAPPTDTPVPTQQPSRPTVPVPPTATVQRKG